MREAGADQFVRVRGVTFMNGSGVVVAFLRPYFGRRGFGVVGICFVCRGARIGEGGSLFCLSGARIAF